jgi:hypothetical protein
VAGLARLARLGGQRKGDGMGNDATDFWKRWIQLQLDHNLEKMVELSIKNFHFPGLNYVCFEFTPAHTVRLYIVNPRDDLETRNVQIHNHLYDSQLLALRGWIKNRVYKVANDRDDYNLYYLTSALHPDNAERKIKLEFLRKKGLDVVQEILLTPGQSHFQKHTEIHSVENDPSQVTAFMVFEFPTVKKHSVLFTQRDLGDTIPTENCYLRYEPEELRSLVQEMLDGMP